MATSYSKALEILKSHCPNFDSEIFMVEWEMDTVSIGRWIEWTLDREDGRSSVDFIWAPRSRILIIDLLVSFPYTSFNYTNDETRSVCFII